ncbi:MAG: UDP-N-acetylmuramoyl-L-alanine--D-glutamate ligase [Chloroflexi bacterium]|nr:UDP-N-acetylmuramoyl-L-alanine--D-glutamate ligase [Chloroflexota bacterium]
MSARWSLADLAGRRVTVMGLGTRQGGAGVAAFLARRGAVVTVTDRQPAAALAAGLAPLDGLPVRFVLGEHRTEDFIDTDLVVKNPAVPWTNPYLAAAVAAGVPVEMEMSLFLRLCPAPVIGVTGTKGKTTTATLCAAMLSTGRPETVLAGNMGISALAALDQITPATPVVLEISSFQLEATDRLGLSPHIAVITNVTADHLDRYASFAEYADAKRAIARHQRPDDWLVLNAADPVSAAFAASATGRVVWAGAQPGAAWRAGQLHWRDDPLPVLAAGDVRLPGEHGRIDVALAAAAALLADATADEVKVAVRGFTGVPHRYERVAVIDGVTYINDTAATAPAAALRALESTPPPVVWIGGGHDKGLDLTAVAQAAAARAEVCLLLAGSATAAVADALAAAGAHRIVGPLGSMAEAVTTAASLAAPGATVLLAPGTASFGLFRDEFDRGEQFRAAVAALAPSA